MPNQAPGPGEHRTTVVTEVVTLRLSRGEIACRCSVIDGAAVFEGDIVLRRPLEAQGIVIVGTGVRWPKATIVWDLDANLPDQDRVHEAMQHWEAHTPIRFKRRSAEADYVLFRPGSGCSSAVGKIGGVQWLTLGPECTSGNAIHELGHTVGLWHEQSRADRDQHISIDWTNIDQQFSHNFDQHLTDGDDVGVYDFESIMHYPANAFALDPTKPTIIVPAGVKVGQREKLSAGDIATVKAIYS